MLIDWFTVSAQMLNFLILVWLLKRFLYKPILDAIDAREKRIATELADIDTKKAQVLKERDEFQRSNDEFEQQRTARLSKMNDEVNAERQRLLEEARKAAVVLSSKQQEALRNEQLSLHKAIIRRTQQEVIAIARKTLTDLAGTSLEERMVDIFVRRLHELTGDQKRLVSSAPGVSSSPAIVRSTFDLPAAQRALTVAAIKETFGSAIQVQFETAPDLIGGIELVMNGQKLAWSIADYLSSLGKGVDELLKEKDAPGEKAAPTTEEPTPVTKSQ